jgi:CRP-like cAMP-binding protein
VYGQGAIVVQQGEPGQRAYILLDGRAEVVVETPEGQVVLATLGPGAVFGEMALLTGRPRSATVRALWETRVQPLDRQAFLQRLHADPAFAQHILEQMCARIQSLDAELARLRAAHGLAIGARAAGVWL